MTLTQKHRNSIYRSLTPILGEEEAEAMLAEFPAGDGAELVTKDFLRAELADLRTGIAELRTEMHSQLRQQLIWMLATIFTSITVSVTLSALLG